MSEETKNNDPSANKEEKKVYKEGALDDQSLHAYMVLGTRFEIEKRYEIVDPIGSSAYGVVVAAKDQ